MIKETIVYKDFNENEIIEDFYFNLTKDELILFGTDTNEFTEMMHLNEEGLDLNEMIEKIKKETNIKETYRSFRDIILLSYGEKSEDGRRFVKSVEKTKAFEESNAFSELIMSLLQDADKASSFIDGILPSDMRAQVNEMMNNATSNNS